MKKVLIVSGHPDIDKSVANKAELEEYAKLLPDAEIDRLDLVYPDYKIDVSAEQAKLSAADIIVLQYPIFWYQMPSLLKKWAEAVFLHGFAYGSRGHALDGKDFIVSFTTGRSESQYVPGATVTLNDLVAPPKGICETCRMNWTACEHLFGVSYSKDTDENACEDIANRARETARKVVEIIKSKEERV